MTALSILTKFMQKTPARVRFGILVIFALVVIGSQVAEIWVTVPGEVYRTLVLIGGYLGVQSAVNVEDE